MEIKDLLNKCEEIIATLPVAHYLKVKTLKVEFSTTDGTSYFSPTEGKISIAFNNISSAIKNCKALDDLQLEKVIRGLLYHEVSHAIMTPADYMRYAYTYSTNGHKINQALANIIEDERIETLLKHYYTNVDFVENKKLILTFDKRNSVFFEGFVFNAVRFRYSPIKQAYVNGLVNNYIKKTENLNATTPGYELVESANDLCVELKKVYEEFVKMLEKLESEIKSKSTEKDDSKDGDTQDGEGTSNNQETETNESEESSSEESTDTTETEKSEGEESEDNEESEEENDAENGETTESELSEESKATNDILKDMAKNSTDTTDLDSDATDELTEQEIEEMNEEIEKEIADVINSMVNKAFRYAGFNNISAMVLDKPIYTELFKIIARNEGFGVKENTAQYGYSGRFNAKRFATDFNDSCKWFKKNAMVDAGANARKSQEKVINIWLDNSGSYYRHDLTTNKVLRALIEIENKRDDFKFNLIKVDENLTLLKGNERYSMSSGGNRIMHDEWLRMNREVNPTGNERNIVLFDGNAISDGGCYENLKCLDNEKTVFITERSNTEGIKRVCTRATIIEENRNYEDRLVENISKAFESLF